MKTLARCFLSISLIVLFSGCEIFTEDPPGAIQGKVVDLNGTHIADANISTFPKTRSVVSKTDGTFQIEDVPQAEYTVIGTRHGYYESREEIAVFCCETSEVIIHLGQDCHAPNAAYNPRPADGLINLPLSLILRWQCDDPDPGDELRYDIYCGTTNPPHLLVASDLESPSFIKG